MKLKQLPKTNPVSFRGAWWFLSNMSLYPVLDYPSAENAYQASKCANIKDREQFKHCSPKEAKSLGRRVNLKPNFNEQRIDIMRKVLEIKFHNRDLALMLIGITGEIVERNTWHDNFWGVCNCSKCLSSGKTANAQNNLGKLLMALRTPLNQDETLRQTHSTYLKQNEYGHHPITPLPHSVLPTHSNATHHMTEHHEVIPTKGELVEKQTTPNWDPLINEKLTDPKSRIVIWNEWVEPPKPEPTEDVSHKTQTLVGI